MLDIMRRKQRLKIILWVVIFSLALGMLLFFVPGVNISNVSTETSAATVDGRTIPMNDLIAAYSRTIKNYSNAGRNRIDPETLKALGLSRQVLDSLIATKVVEILASRLGVDVSPDEIRQAVETFPYLQDQGKFIGVDRYKAILAANNISVTEFEEDMRFSQLQKKVRAIITDSMDVTDRELRDEFARSNQQTQVDFVILKKEDFKKRVKPTEPDLKAYFEGHKDAYKVKERRRAQYLLIPTSQILPTIKVSEQEILEDWNQRPHQETVYAAHIMFRVEDPAKDAEIKAKAENALKMVQAGGDFAKLAKTYSDDTGTQNQGGVLPPLQRGQQTKEFEDALFALKPGETSGLVRTEAGYHIIRMLRRDNPTLEASRNTIIGDIQLRKARAIAQQKAEEAARIALKNQDLNLAAKDLGVVAEVRETKPFSKDANAFELGISQALKDEIFELKAINAVGKAVEHTLGYAVPKLIEVQMPRPGEFNESRAQIERDYLESKAKELMQAEAKKLSEDAGKQGSLEKSAKTMGFSVKTSQPFKTDGAPDPEIGTNPAFSSAAFDLPVGSVSGPIVLLDNVSVLQVKSRTPFNDAEFQKQKPGLRNKILPSIQDQYFQEYVRKVTEDLEKSGKIRVNPKALENLPVNY
jgi:peptidyl-prolyl cis-trans isomerase D